MNDAGRSIKSKGGGVIHGLARDYITLYGLWWCYILYITTVTTNNNNDEFIYVIRLFQGTLHTS